MKRKLNPRIYIVAAMAVLIACTLPGCGGTPARPGKAGGYYLDDGPGDNPPANLDSIPEPTPKVEPINRFSSRPYTVLGRTYTPYEQLTPYKVRGVASWYGKRYHGQKTSIGETYDMYSMSAAHTLLPLPSYARVTNTANGKSVVVRINDRGPFHDDRIIDLSWLAAQRLGLLASGSGTVEVQAIIPGAEPAVVAPAPPPKDAVSVPAPAAAAGNPAAAAGVAKPDPGILPPPPVSTQAAGGSYVQLGAFSVVQNADAFLRKMRTDLAWLAPAIGMDGIAKFYLVRAGPYASRADANRVAQRVQQELGLKVLVIDR